MTAPPDPPVVTLPVLAARLGSWRLNLEREPLDRAGLAARYDAAAPGWPAALARHDMPRAYEALLRDALGGSATSGPLVALDCGIGTGALSLALARAAPGPITVDGIDLSSGMLRAAETALSAEGVPVRTRLGDLTALPYADARFDLAMAAHAVEHLPDPRIALREMIRVTRPGGRVVICATQSTLRGFLIQLGWRTHRIAPAKLGRWMREAGLVRVRRLRAGSRRFDALSSAWVGMVPETDRRGRDLED